MGTLKGNTVEITEVEIKIAKYDHHRYMKP